MSSISGAGSGLFSFLQQFNSGTSAVGATATTATTATTDPSATAATTSSTDPSATGAATEKPHHHHHGGGHGGGGMSKISQAVTSALQSAQADGSNADPNQIVEDAISKVLQGTGLGQGAATGTTTGTTDGSTQAAGADPNNTTGQTDTDPNSPQTFFQTLQQFGVSPQQFHSDFLSAVKDAQGGQVDPTTAFQSFPPGMMVDTMG